MLIMNKICNYVNNSGLVFFVFLWDFLNFFTTFAVEQYSLMKQLCFILFFCISQLLPAQPKIEIRAVWLTVNFGLDWPDKPFKNKYDIEQQKNDLTRILDSLKAINMNMVFFQVRFRGEVIYPSRIEPRSPNVKSTYATDDYDPLLYAVEECHKRGIECHAWLNIYPLGPENPDRNLNRTFQDFYRRRIIKSFKDNLYLDPGNPQTDIYLLSLIREVVSNYDVDGIHFDYIRYPEPAADFPDNDTYRFYGRGKNKSDWRRENINRFVYGAYDLIKSLKPWVQLSSSVVGMYKELPGIGRRHWTAYSSVYQDPVDWLSKGKHDFIVPMNYYSGTLYYPFVEDWVLKNNERFVVSGLGVYQMDVKESAWKASVLYEQVKFSRDLKTNGNAYFRAAFILNNSNDFGKGLRSRYYSSPALLPPLTWLNRTIPDAPTSLSAYSKGSFLQLTWDKSPEKDKQPVLYNLYRSKTFPIDIENPQNIVATRLRDTEFLISVDNSIETGYYYVLTAYDRYHNESASSRQVFFVTGNFEK